VFKQNKSLLDQNIDSDLVHRLLKKSCDKSKEDEEMNASIPKLNTLMTRHAIKLLRG
jgi:hypothetical protein